MKTKTSFSKSSLFVLFSLSIFFSSFSQTLLQESFEGQMFPPANWHVQSYQVTPSAVGVWQLDTTSTYAFSGKQSAQVRYSFDTARSTLFTPTLNFQAGATYRISFFTTVHALKYPRISVYATNSPKIEDTLVYIGECPVGFNTYASYRHFDFRYTPTTGGNQHIAFMSLIGKNDAGGYWLDSITIEKVPICNMTPIARKAWAADSACMNALLVLNYDSLATNEKYQWQISDAGLNNWTDIVNATNAVQTVRFTRNAKYRCRVSCTGGASFTLSNEFIVQEKKVNCSCTGQPVLGTITGSDTACIGTYVQLIYNSAGIGETYQWQSSDVGSGVWFDLNNATNNNATIYFVISKKYRCKVTCVTSGQYIYSNEKLVSQGLCTPSGNCAQPVYPANGEQLVELKYDKDSVSINQPGVFNGVQVKWKKIPGVSQYYVFMNPSFPTGAGIWQQVYPGSINDTTTILPVQYGNTYQWFVSTDPGTSSPCNASVVSVFTTIPPPPLCKPSCNGGGLWSWDQSVYKLKLTGEQNMVDIYVQPCYNYFNNKASLPGFIPGNSYPASYLDIGNTSFRNNCWIDFNDNGYFETNELIGVIVRGLQYGEAFNSFYIPLSSTPGIHRMRFVPMSVDPCSIGDQSVADFYVQILSAQTKNYSLAENSVKNACVCITTSSAQYFNNEWRQLVDKDGKLVAAVHPKGNMLGSISVCMYQNSGPVRTLPNNTKVLDRSLEIKPEFQPTTPVDVRLYFSQAEFNALKAADNTVTDIASLNISKFSSGCGEAFSGYDFIGATSTGSINGYHYIQFTTSSFSDFYIRGGGDAVLPVQFINTKASREGKDVLVSWETVSEQNNNGFDIEVSGDGSSFQKIGFVKSKSNAGNSNVSLPYVFRHQNAPGGNLVYRLKQIDKDGKASYSQLMKVNAMGTGKISIVKLYPNPSREKAQLELHADISQAIQLEIVNSAGMLVKKWSTNVANGESRVWLDLSGIPAGIYLVSIADKEGHKIDQVKLNKL